MEEREHLATDSRIYFGKPGIGSGPARFVEMMYTPMAMPREDSNCGELTTIHGMFS